MEDMSRNTIVIRRLKTITVFKLFWLFSWLSIFPLFVLFGLLALAGMNYVRMNGVPQTGPKGLLIAIVLGFLFVLLNTVFMGTAAAIGLRIYSLFRPLTLKVVPMIEIRTREITDLFANTLFANDKNDGSI